MFGIYTEDYPINYDFLSDFQKETIINVYNRSCKGEDVSQEFAELMRSFGICIEWGWAGHSENAFLATQDDAEYEIDVIYSHMD